MKLHTVKFEIIVPDKATKAEVLEVLDALLELLDYKSKNLELDPPPDVRVVPPWPKDDRTAPFTPYEPPKPDPQYPYYKPWRCAEERWKAAEEKYKAAASGVIDPR